MQAGSTRQADTWLAVLWRSRVARRLLLWTLGLGSLGMAGLTAWEVATEEAAERRELQSHLVTLSGVIAPALEKSLWAFDRRLIDLQLQALAGSPDVSQLLLDAKGLPVQKLGAPAVSDHVLRHEVALEYAEDGQRHRLGQLTLVKDLAPEHARRMQGLWAHASVKGLMVLLVALGTAALYHVLVTRRLLGLADRLRGVTPADLQRLAASPLPSQPVTIRDELDELAASVTALQLTSGQALAGFDERHSQVRSLMDALPDHVWMKSVEGVYLACNPRFTAFFGRSEADFLGRRDHDLFEADLADRFLEFDRQAAASGQPLSSQDWVTSFQGERRLFETIKCRVRAQDGRPIGVLGIARDMTDRHRDAETLREREELFRSIVAQAGDGIDLVDLETLQIIETNEASCRLTGYTRDEYLALRLSDLVTFTDADGLREVLSRAPVVGHLAMPSRMRTKDGRQLDTQVSMSLLVVRGRRCVLGVWRDVSQEKAALEAIATAAEWHRALFYNTVEGVSIWDDQGRLVEANARFAEMLGYEMSELLRLAPADIDPRYGEGALDTAVPPSLGTSVTFETRHRRKDGSFYDAEVSMQSAHIAGRLVQVSITRDTTARNRAREALHQREEIYRSIVSQAADGIVLIDPADGRFVEFNDAACAQLGYTRGEFERLSVSDLRLEPNQPLVPAWPARLLQQSGASVERRVRHKDGSIREVAISSRPIDFQGRTLIAAVGHDVTRRKADERELQRLNTELEQRVEQRTADLQQAYRQLLDTQFAMENVGIGILWADAATRRFVFVNRFAAEFHGYTIEQMLDLRIGDIDPTFGDDSRGRTARMRQHGHVRFETMHVHRDGSRLPVEMTVFYQDPGDGEPARYIGFMTDIRRRKDAENILRQAKESADAASLAKSAFLANMSHEIRSPLNAISGMAYLIRRGGLAPEQAERMGKLEAASEHLLSIIDTVLELSKIEAGKFVLTQAPLRVQDLLANVVAILQDRAEAKGLHLHTEVPGDLPVLMGDATRLQQALLNYAGNAIKFTDRGRVTLRARVRDETAAALRLYFEVEDTGIGIPAEALPRLFTAFEQADNSATRRHGGTGLGLAITKKIAQMMGGETGVRSEPGAGSLFWFTARLERAPADATPPATAGGEALIDRLKRRHAGRRILLAEDEPINREVAIELLKDAGLQVDPVENGRQALSLLERQRYDLVLMDVQMPVMDGLTATRAVRRLPDGHSVPIIAMTANAFEDDRRVCAEAGMSDFVAKPVHPPLLYATVLKWLEQPHAPSPEAPLPEPVPEPARPVSDPRPSAARWLERLRGLPGVQVDRGLAQVRGRQDRYVDLMRRLAQNAGTDLVQLKDRLGAADAMAMARVAHSLKGAAATLCAEALSQRADQVEQAARALVSAPFERERLDPLLRQLQDEWLALAAALDLPVRESG